MYGLAFGYIAGTTHTNGLAKVASITDWSAPTFTNINSSTSARDEIDIEEMPDGTLRANIRNDTSGNFEESHSTDHGATWSAPSVLFVQTGWPAWRALTSGIGLSVNRDPSSPFHAVWRQTATGTSDSGWSTATTLDSLGFDFEYATILQLDDNHVLVIYAYQATSGSATECDIYSQVFTDSTIFATGGTVRVSSTDTSADFLEDKLVAGSNVTITKLHTGGDETLEIAATVSGIPSPSTAIPLVESGTGAAGSATPYSREDHVHPAAASSSGQSHAHVENVLFSGDGSSTVFHLPVAPLDAYSVSVFVAGSLSQDWTLSDGSFQTITFGSAPTSGTSNIAVDIVAATY
jgi:hypothetical protein